jgi:hypothetical protein
MALIPVSCCCSCCAHDASSASPNNKSEACGGWLQTTEVEGAQFQTNLCQFPGNACDVDGAQLPLLPVMGGTSKLCPVLAVEQGPGLLPPR